MRLEQVLYGAPNDRAGIVSSVALGSNRYTIYGSAARVIVLDGELREVQVIPPPQTPQALRDDGALDVQCIHTSTSGKIAASYGWFVLVYKPTAACHEQQELVYQWAPLATLVFQYPVPTLCWSPTHGHLLIGGRRLSLWVDKALCNTEPVAHDVEGVYVAAWEADLARPATQARFSPDGGQFVTMGDNDRFPRVWFRRCSEDAEASSLLAPPDTLAFDFMYLPHPARVIHCSWRPYSKSLWNRFHSNTLLTSCEDHVCRVWSETSQQEHLAFFISGVISADQISTLGDPVTPDSQFVLHWLNTQKVFSAFTHDSGQKAPDPATAPGADHSGADEPRHLCAPTTAHRAPNTSGDQRPLLPDAHTVVDRALMEQTKHKFPDTVFCMHEDGSLIFWRLAGLDEQRRSPTITLVQRVPNALPRADAKRQQLSLIAYPDRRRGAIARPVEPPSKSTFPYVMRHTVPLAILHHQRGGPLVKWRVGLLEQPSFPQVTSVEDVGRCCGHAAPLSQLRSHPFLKCIVSLSTARDEAPGAKDADADPDASPGRSELIFWKAMAVAEAPTRRIFPLREITRFAASSALTTVEWLPAAAHLALVAADAEGVVALACSTSDQSAMGAFAVRPAARLAVAGVVSLHTCTASLAANSDRRSFRVLALTSEGRAFTWTVDIQAAPSASPARTPPSAAAALKRVVAHITQRGLREVALPSAQPIGSAATVLASTSALPGGSLGPPGEILLAAVAGPSLGLWRFSTAADGGTDRGEDAAELAAVGPACEIGGGAGWTSQPVAVAPDGRVACLAAEPDLVQIWECASSAARYRREAELKLPAPAQALAWLSDGLTAVALAACVSDAVLLYSQTSSSASGAWQLLRRTPLPRRVEAPVRMEWTTSGVLAVASAANEVYVLSKFGLRPPRPADALARPAAFASVFRQAEARSAALPQVHPTFLLAMLMEGQFGRVRALLKRLAAAAGEREAGATGEAGGGAPRGAGAAAARLQPLFVPPLTMHEMQSVGGAETTASGAAPPPAVKPQDYSSLFEAGGGGGGVGDEEGVVNGPDASLFSAEEGERLRGHLANTQLVGLSPGDQMRLIGIVDSFAEVDASRASMDGCAVRFLTAVRQFHFLRRSLPPGRRPKSLAVVDFLWALHSSNQERFLDLDPMIANHFDEFDWRDLRALGAGFWLENLSTLKRYVEQLAKNRFQRDQNPLDAVLFYVALGKSRTLRALFRSAGDVQKADFFGHDHTEPRWATAAVKNAFQLLGQKRFEESAAFFLLGGQLEDACNVCLRYLKDPQLALVLCRLSEGPHGEVFQGVVRDALEPARSQGEVCMTSLLCWLLRDYAGAVTALVGVSDAASEAPNTVDDSSPAQLNLFLHLRQTKQAQLSLAALPVPVGLYHRAAYASSQLGLPLLALDTLRQLRVEQAAHNEEHRAAAAAGGGVQALAVVSEMVSSGTLDMASFGLGAPAPKPAADTSAQINSGTLDMAAFGLGATAATPKPKPAADTSAQISSGTLDMASFGLGAPAPKPAADTSAQISSGTLDMASFGFGAPTPARTAAPTTRDSHPALLPPETTPNDAEGSAAPEESAPGCRALHLARRVCLAAQASVSALKDGTPETWAQFAALVDEEVQAILALGDGDPNTGVTGPKDETALLFLFQEHARNYSNLLFEVRLAAAVAPRKAFVPINRTANELLHAIAGLLGDTLRAATPGVGGLDGPGNPAAAARREAVLEGACQQAEAVSAALFEAMANATVAPTPVALAGFCVAVWMARLAACWARADHSGLLRLLQRPPNARMFEAVCGPGAEDAAGACGLLQRGQAQPRTTLAALLQQPMGEEAEGRFAACDALADFGVEEDGPEAGDDASRFRWLLLETVLFQHACLAVRPTLEGAEVDATDLSRQSPALYALLCRLESRVHELEARLAADPLPTDDRQRGSGLGLAAGGAADGSHQSQVIFRIKRLIEPSANPFKGQAVRRVWHTLVRSEGVHTTVERAIFPEDGGEEQEPANEWVTVHHGRYEASDAAVEVMRASFMVVASKKAGLTELQLAASGDGGAGGQEGAASPGQGATSSGGGGSGGAAALAGGGRGRRAAGGVRVALHRPALSVRGVAAHPSMPHYLTGNAEHVVQLWQFGQPGCLGSFARGGSKITRLAFDTYGSKFGITDAAGALDLWRFGNHAAPYARIDTECRRLNDFTFLSSSSIVATAGHSQSGRGNVAIWDSLLPPAKQAVAALGVNEGGAHRVAFVHRGQQLLCGGRRGQLAVVDVRQRRVMAAWTAHDSVVKSVVVDEPRDRFLTASSDGSVKLWSLSTHALVKSWDGVHARGNVFKSGVQNLKTGVQHLALTHDALLYAVGADGLVKRCHLASDP